MANILEASAQGKHGGSDALKRVQRALLPEEASGEVDEDSKQMKEKFEDIVGSLIVFNTKRLQVVTLYPE